MVIGALVLISAMATTDQGGWHVYQPEGSGIRFSMPGTVYGDSKPDPKEGSKMYRYHSKLNGIQFEIVYGDVASKYAADVKTLWTKDPNGDTVKQILGNTLQAAADGAHATITFTKFGNMKGFPTMADIFDHGDGTGSNEMAVFTKRGIVIAAARSPKTEDGLKQAVRFIDSVDLSARK